MTPNVRFPRGLPVASPWRADLSGVLITETEIAGRVRALARCISQDYRDREPVIVPLLSGTVLFVADLIRHLDFPLRLEFMGVSSYRDQTRPGALEFTKALRCDLRGRDVLLVDDILDTGQTLGTVTRVLRRMKPRTMRVCVLLQKEVPRRMRIRPHYVGFRIPNAFVVGYGLDYAERFRNLPFIGVLRPPGNAAMQPGDAKPPRRRGAVGRRFARGHCEATS